MRKGLVLFVLFIATLSACQKTSNSSNQPTTYRVDFVTDHLIAFDTGANLGLSYSIVYLGPVQETVTLSLENLPAGIYIDTTVGTTTTGIPNFNAGFTLKNAGTAKSGTYKITLVCTGSVTGRKTYTFNLRVLLPTTCTSGILNKWTNNTELCTGTLYIDSIYKDMNILNRIHFTNFVDSGFDVYVDLYCKASTFTLPLQNVGMHYYWGIGSFSSSYIHISYSDSVAGSPTVGCGVNMLR